MTPDEKRLFALSFPVHVGVDTSKTFHVAVARGPDGKRLKPYRVPVSRAGFEAGEAQLRSLFPDVRAEQVLVGLEFAGHHGFTYARYLADQGHTVVNVLPANTKRTKEIEDNSPLKTDAKDAGLICKLTGDGTFVRFPFLKSPYIELRLLTVHRHRLTVEATRYKNRLQGLLDLAWPEFVAQFSRLDKATPRAILEAWPLPRDLLAASRRKVKALAHSASRGHFGDDRLDALWQSAERTIGLPEAAPARRLEIEHLIARWALVDTQIAGLDAEIERVVQSCPEAAALTTVPEVSATCAATIVAELGTPEDFEHPRQVLKLAGMNLVGRSSGLQSEARVMKWQSKCARPMLRRQLFLLAGRWCQQRGLYHEYYEALKARNGGLRTKAVCSVARKLVPLLLAVVKRKEPFDVVRWQANRHRLDVRL